jgi:hypothetical protein
VFVSLWVGSFSFQPFITPSRLPGLIAKRKPVGLSSFVSVYSGISSAYMEVIFMGTGTSQGVPMIACDCAVCRSVDPRDQRTRSCLHVVMDGLHIQIDAAP